MSDPRDLVCWFARADISKRRRLSGLKTHLHSPGSGGGKSKTEVSAGSARGQPFLPPSSPGLPSACVCVLASPSDDASRTAWESPLVTSF